MMKRCFQWTIEHLYITLILVSGIVMSLVGYIMMSYAGENYGQQEALAGLAIHQIKIALLPPEEGEGYLDLGDDTVAYADIEGEAFVDDGEDDMEDFSEGDEDEATLEDTESQSAQEQETTGIDSLEAEKQTTSEADENMDVEEIDEKIDPESKNNTEDDNKEDTDEESKEKSSEESDKDSEEDSDEEHKKNKSSSKKKKKSKWKTVDEDYFADALFIGDSRQQGFGLFSGIENTTVYARKSYVITKVSTLPIVETPIGKITVADALAIQQHKYKKIYIMFGLNEMGSYTPDQMDQYYYNFIDYLKKMQPGATIYIESIIHVSKQKAMSTPIFDNAKIDERNEHLKKVAKNEKVVYLNLNNVLTDEEGNLFADAASDGVHLKGEYIQIWKEYLMSHVANVDDDKEDDEYDYVELTEPQRIFKEQLDAYYANLNPVPAESMTNPQQ